MATENTHSLAVTGAGVTTATDVTVGQIIMPAGGPWVIHNIFGQVVRATATAGESNQGQIVLQSASGDIVPNPAPSIWPLIESGSFLGATADQSVCPLHIYDVNFEAAGKAAINLIYRQPTTVTVAPQLVLGVMFGKTRPAPSHWIYSDLMRAQVTTAAEISIGTVTLAERATRITGVMATITQDNVITAGEELIGICRLASDDIDLTPFQFPTANAFGAGLGGLIQSATNLYSYFLPVDIPVTGGARIQGFLDLNTAVTNACECEIYIAYE